ncbi:MAG TPA: GH116 family glycosyl hydrolase [Melioribacteraceae bacterium]|nr:GH116 family glycosyl hydrolase [Melioribacteraceae bacterium]
MKQFETKYGYFENDGKEFVIKTPKTPKPWVNVISNGSYGLIISQTGGGFSWNEHSEFNRITRWHQDLIKDDWGKYFYFRNNKTGEVFSPLWQPVKTEFDFFECRYGLGYATFTTEYKGIKIICNVFVPFNETLEIWDFNIENKSNEDLDLSIYTYFEWVLGSSNDYHREFHKTFLETDFDKELNSLVASKRLWDIPLGDRGHWNIQYEYLGFLSSSKPIAEYEGDKEAFIGNYGSLNYPEALKEGKLQGKLGKFNDSIGTIKVNLEIPKDKSEDVSFYIGLKENKNEINKSLNKLKEPNVNKKLLDEVKATWETLLGDLYIETPDEAMNISVNYWFRYQAISGRLWGRTAYYQQSGAFGFRDQLQDSLVYLPIEPKLTENQIKLHARHQFEDGAVLHWWHPIAEVGLETKMTDDLLWLPFVLMHYINETGNIEILNDVEPFYRSEKSGSLYEHCYKAIEKVLSRFSDRGLPLIGAGDWNDGLSAVGLEMKGESVWLAEFFYYVLTNFADIAERFNKKQDSEYFTKKAKELKEAFDKYAWDGKWYYRGTKDSGEKFGSDENEDGKIFLNPQIWAVMSDIAPKDKVEIAMQSVKDILFKGNGPLLLYPGYSKPDKYIGYLSRYAPGRRENAGVYTHAATWSIWAFAKLKDNEFTYEAFKRLCPIYSGMEPDKYVAEPYVTPGNIDGPDSPNYGMAGWTWYTGSASWFQKVIVDWLLGVRTTNEGLVIDPCVPNNWKTFKVKRKFMGKKINLTFINENNVSGLVKEIKGEGVVVEGNVIKSVLQDEVNLIVSMG